MLVCIYKTNETLPSIFLERRKDQTKNKLPLSSDYVIVTVAFCTETLLYVSLRKIIISLLQLYSQRKLGAKE